MKSKKVRVLMVCLALGLAVTRPVKAGTISSYVDTIATLQTGLGQVADDQLTPSGATAVASLPANSSTTTSLLSIAGDSVSFSATLDHVLDATQSAARASGAVYLSLVTSTDLIFTLNADSTNFNFYFEASLFSYGTNSYVFRTGLADNLTGALPAGSYDLMVGGATFAFSNGFVAHGSASLSIVPAPEPSTLALAAIGFAAVTATAGKKRRG